MHGLNSDGIIAPYDFRFLPIKRSTERLQQSFLRQDAKTAKKNIFLFLRTWRPLRLCSSPRGISFTLKRYLFIHGIIPRDEPRGIPTRPRSSCSPETVFHRASHLLSDSLNPNSTENFKNVWLDFGFPIVSSRQVFFTVLLPSGISPVFILASYFPRLYTNPS